MIKYFVEKKNAVKNKRSNVSLKERGFLTGRLICRSSLKFGLWRHRGHVYLACE